MKKNVLTKCKLNNRIKEIQPEYDKKSKLFHSQKEVEGLYQNISNFASSNNLNIINLNKESSNFLPIPYSRQYNGSQYVNFNDPKTYKPNLESDFIIVSFAPIWSLSNFLNYIFYY